MNLFVHLGTCMLKVRAGKGKEKLIADGLDFYVFTV